jgi:hypothetical protein
MGEALFESLVPHPPSITIDVGRTGQIDQHRE